MFKFQVTEKLGMPRFFIHMIALLFQDVVVSININNQVAEPFELHRGVHQGCPLAPYLFIIVAKALNAPIKNAMRIGLVISILLPQSTSQQIICQYVDDTSFSARAEDSNVDNLIKILHNFEFDLGLEMNWHKSVAYWCGR